MAKPKSIRHMVLRELSAFLATKRSRKLAQNTSIYYEDRLRPFIDFCELHKILYMQEITHEVITDYLSFHEPNHSEGGLWHFYASLKAFLRWYIRTAEPEGWKNPIDKVDPPKRSREPIRGITPEEFQREITECRMDLTGVRDRAILGFLYDTGVRVTELVNIRMDQVDMKAGAAFVEHGKGGKSRFIFFGDECRVELNRYFRKRRDNDTYLFTSLRGGGQLTRGGIEEVCLKYANLAGVTSLPSPHDFRRAWVHETRKRASDLTTARVAGHSNTKLLARYDYQTKDDLLEAISGSSPLDNLRSKRDK